MELVSHIVPVKTRSCDEILIMPLGDIQWIGDKNDIEYDLLQERVAWGVKHGCYFVGMGDYLDTFSPSNRERLNGAALYDTAKKGIDKMASDLVVQLYKDVLRQTKGKWLGLVEGHHFHTYRSGGTTDQHLCTLLDAKFLGTTAFIRLILTLHNVRMPVTLWVQHGNGGGKRMAAPLNQLDQLPGFFEADIYLIGHHTRQVGGPMVRLEAEWGKTGGRLVARKKIVACTGGFMRGYIEGSRDGGTPRGNYVEQKSLLPTALGTPVVKILPKRFMRDGVTSFTYDLRLEQ